MSRVTTRFAPTINGSLHCGHLWNALLNYIIAKQNNGVFFTRFDGIKLSPFRDAYQKSLEEDLNKFGLVPDFLVRQSDRRELYQSKMIELLEQDGVYFCDCTASDITRRAVLGSCPIILERPEKYPPCSKISHIQLLNRDSENVVPRSTVSATAETSDDPITNILNNDPALFWQPFNPGYFGLCKPVIEFSFFAPQWIQSVEITYKNYPWRAWSVFATFDGKESKIAALDKESQFCYDSTGQGQAYLSGFCDQLSFASAPCDSLRIVPEEYMIDVRREYVYDGYCQDRELDLDLDDRYTVVRGISNYPDYPDTVFWIYQVADLSFTSAIDDQEFGVTHSIRGEDIRPFIGLEMQAARRIGYEPQNYVHGEILNPQMYKYSKSDGSRPAREYLEIDGIDADAILSYLAYRTGLIPKLEKLSLNNLVKQSTIEWPRMLDNVIIDEGKMLEDCSKI